MVPALAAAMIAAAASACSTPSTPSPTAEKAPVTSAPLATSAPKPGPVSTPEVQELCDHIKGSLSDWRIQTPTLTHPALNVLVQAWGLEHGITADLVSNRKLVDELTTAQCADVRAEALQALVLPDFASGLIGLG